MGRPGQAERKPRLAYASLTATVALFLSLTSLYFTWFREVHSLKLGIVPSDTVDVSLPFTLSTDLVLLNRGNRTETVLALNPVLAAPSEHEGERPGWHKGPFVLKAGDALPVHVAWTITENDLGNVAEWSGPSLERSADGDLLLSVSTISAEGAEIRKNILLGRLHYYEPSGEVTLKLTTRRVRLVELLER